MGHGFVLRVTWDLLQKEPSETQDFFCIASALWYVHSIIPLKTISFEWLRDTEYNPAGLSFPLSYEYKPSVAKSIPVNV